MIYLKDTLEGLRKFLSGNPNSNIRDVEEREVNVSIVEDLQKFFERNEVAQNYLPKVNANLSYENSTPKPPDCSSEYIVFEYKNAYFRTPIDESKGQWIDYWMDQAVEPYWHSSTMESTKGLALAAKQARENHNKTKTAVVSCPMEDATEEKPVVNEKLAEAARKLAEFKKEQDSLPPYPGDTFVVFKHGPYYYRVGLKSEFCDRWEGENTKKNYEWQNGNISDYPKELQEAALEARKTGGIKIAKPAAKQTYSYQPGPAYGTPEYDRINYVEFEHDGKKYRRSRNTSTIETYDPNGSTYYLKWRFTDSKTITQELADASFDALEKVGVIKSKTPTDSAEHARFQYNGREFRIVKKPISQWQVRDIAEWNKKDRDWSYFCTVKSSDLSQGMKDAANDALVACGGEIIEDSGYRAKAREEVNGKDLNCFVVEDAVLTEADMENIGSIKDKCVKPKENKAAVTQRSFYGSAGGGYGRSWQEQHKHGKQYDYGWDSQY